MEYRSGGMVLCTELLGAHGGTEYVLAEMHPENDKHDRIAVHFTGMCNILVITPRYTQIKYNLNWRFWNRHVPAHLADDPCDLFKWMLGLWLTFKTGLVPNGLVPVRSLP